MAFGWDSATEDRLVSLWASGVALADIPRAIGAAGPEAVNGHIQLMRGTGRWPEAADRQRKVALAAVVCQQCGQRFADHRGLGQHVSRSGHSQALEGDEEDEPAADAQAAKEQTTPAETPPRGRTRTCPVCAKAFAAGQGLAAHVRHIHPGVKVEPTARVPIVGEAVASPSAEAPPGPAQAEAPATFEVSLVADLVPTDLEYATQAIVAGSRVRGVIEATVDHLLIDPGHRYVVEVRVRDKGAAGDA